MTQTTQPDPWAASKAFLKDIYMPWIPAEARLLFAGTFDIPGTPIPLEVRYKQAQALSAKGMKLDGQIVGEGYDALSTQNRRQFYGYTTWPDMSQGSNVDPVSGQIDYSNPAFTLPVGSDPSLYPASGEPDIVPVLYVGARMNNDGDYNTQNSPETSINPLTGKLFVADDTVYEQKHTFKLVGPTVLGGYFWQIQGQ